MFCAYLCGFLGILGRFLTGLAVILCLGNGFAMRVCPKFGRLFLGVFGWIFDDAFTWTFVGRFGGKGRVSDGGLLRPAGTAKQRIF